MSSVGVNAALIRCHTLAGGIESALAKSDPLRDTAALVDVHAALSHAAKLLGLIARNRAGISAEA